VQAADVCQRGKVRFGAPGTTGRSAPAATRRTTVRSTRLTTIASSACPSTRS